MTDVELDSRDYNQSEFEGWDDSGYEMHTELFNQAFDIMMIDADFIRVEGFTQRLTGTTDNLVILPLMTLSKFLTKVGKDINDITLKTNFEKNYIEYSGSHHDGTNHYTLYPVVIKEETIPEIKELIKRYDEVDDENGAYFKEFDITLKEDTDLNNMQIFFENIVQ